MKICNSHKVEFVHKEGVSKLGKAYNFWCCPETLGNGDYCQDKGIEQENFKSVQSFEKSLGDNKNLSMLQCNAMNNAIALACEGKIGLDDISGYYKKILQTLTT